MASTDMDWLKSPKKQFRKNNSASAVDSLAALMAPTDESTGARVVMTEDFANPIGEEVASACDEMAH